MPSGSLKRIVQIPFNIADCNSGNIVWWSPEIVQKKRGCRYKTVSKFLFARMIEH